VSSKGWVRQAEHARRAQQQHPTYGLLCRRLPPAAASSCVSRGAHYPLLSPPPLAPALHRDLSWSIALDRPDGERTRGTAAAAAATAAATPAATAAAVQAAAVTRPGTPRRPRGVAAFDCVVRRHLPAAPQPLPRSARGLTCTLWWRTQCPVCAPPALAAARRVRIRLAAGAVGSHFPPVIIDPTNEF
jgi:hypothetical protein